MMHQHTYIEVFNIIETYVGSGRYRKNATMGNLILYYLMHLNDFM